MATADPVRPAPLRPGDAIALITTSSPVNEPSWVQLTRDGLEALGYRVVEGPNMNGRRGYLAGGDAERAADLQWALGDPEIAAVVSLLGGYGCARLHEHVDWAALRTARPRIVCGYSDLTALHLMIQRELGWVTFHGPNATGIVGRNAFSTEAFWRALRPLPLGAVPADPDVPVWRVAPGTGEGRLAGGNLRVLTLALGTPFAPDLAGRIAVLEEVSCEPYQLEADLVQLIGAGALDDVAGITFTAHEVRGRAYGRSYAHGKSWEEVVQEWLGGLGVPVLANLPFGHGENLATVPLGARARIDGDAGLLEILEPGVEAAA
jgi:muramoyltetrapeptide carboxypeptidase